MMQYTARKGEDESVIGGEAGGGDGFEQQRVRLLKHEVAKIGQERG